MFDGNECYYVFCLLRLAYIARLLQSSLASARSKQLCTQASLLFLSTHISKSLVKSCHPLIHLEFGSVCSQIYTSSSIRFTTLTLQ